MIRLLRGSVGWTQKAGSSASLVPAGLRSIVCAGRRDGDGAGRQRHLGRGEAVEPRRSARRGCHRARRRSGRHRRSDHHGQQRGHHRARLRVRMVPPNVLPPTERLLHASAPCPNSSKARVLPTPARRPPRRRFFTFGDRSDTALSLSEPSIVQPARRRAPCYGPRDVADDDGGATERDPASVAGARPTSARAGGSHYEGRSDRDDRHRRIDRVVGFGMVVGGQARSSATAPIATPTGTSGRPRSGRPARRTPSSPTTST